MAEQRPSVQLRTAGSDDTSAKEVQRCPNPAPIELMDDERMSRTDTGEGTDVTTVMQGFFTSAGGGEDYRPQCELEERQW